MLEFLKWHRLFLDVQGFTFSMLLIILNLCCFHLFMIHLIINIKIDLLTRDLLKNKDNSESQ